MADDTLRQLERRFRDTGSDTDKSAWLRERMRTGELDPSRVRLSALLGDPASERALDARAAPGQGLLDWLVELQEAGGLTALRRAALAATEPLFAAWGDWPCLEETRLSWDQARVFTLCPCREHQPATPLNGWRHNAPALAPWRHLSSLADPSHAAAAVVAAEQRLEPAAPVREAIRAALVPWALGEHDPLRAGWPHPVAAVSRYALIELLSGIPPERAWASRRELHQAALDPALPSYLATMSPPAAADRALRHVLPAADDPALVERLRRQLGELKTAAGDALSFEDYLAGGWRRCRGGEDRPPEGAAGLLFGLP